MLVDIAGERPTHVVADRVSVGSQGDTIGGVAILGVVIIVEETTEVNQASDAFEERGAGEEKG